ncbi:hypothetical protein MSAN_00066100 [Mycena sanguinolenta]|uniref:DUF7918 domain-containing protein n=1 Tax=Mycena sanguinolenta TaxID=230812 RepID=A0A8H6ZF15_9AGAR|nr:hypothetical protein MSAN_00066100 [Mycena sanguinolenta]
MLQCQEFAAWVSIDGTDAPEYGIEVSEDRKSVTCWIASEVGKGASLPQTGSVKPFLFSPLKLTDDDSLLDGVWHERLGLIELRIEPVKVTGVQHSAEAFSLPQIEVHERSKKALTQQITLADPEAFLQPRKFVEYRPTGPELAKFSFKYRPADILCANGIIPASQQPKRKASSEPLRSPSPEYDQADADQEKMLREQLRALGAKRLKTEKKARVKNDPDIVDLTQGGKTKVKTERKSAFVPGEIIDLT